MNKSLYVLSFLFITISNHAQNVDDELLNNSLEKPTPINVQQARVDTSQYKDISKFFLSAPPQVLSLLDKTNRHTLIDYALSGLEAKTENMYGGITYLDSLSTDYLSLQLTKASSWKLIIMRSSEGKMRLFVFHTVCTPSRYTKLSAFDENWKSLSVKMPKLDLRSFINHSRLSEEDRNIMETVSIPSFFEWSYIGKGKLKARLSLVNSYGTLQSRWSDCLQTKMFIIKNNAEDIEIIEI